MRVFALARCLVFFCILQTALHFDLMQIGGKSARFDRFDGMCREDKDVIMLFHYYAIKNIGSKLLLNCTITVKEDIVNPPILTLNIQRCRSKENPDTCEEFHKFSTKQYCKMVQSDSELWSPFFSTIEPKWKCPIKKGKYHALNSTFDVTAFLLFPVDGWFWKVRADMYDSVTNKRTFCLTLEAQVALKPRNRN